MSGAHGPLAAAPRSIPGPAGRAAPSGMTDPPEKAPAPTDAAAAPEGEVRASFFDHLKELLP